MSKDPQVDLIFNHFIPRYVATGVDPNDMKRLVERVDQWSNWCAVWSDEALKHELHGNREKDLHHDLTASESWLKAAIYYHYAKHLFGADPVQFNKAQESMLRCYNLAAMDAPSPIQKLKIPYKDDFIHAYLRTPLRQGRGAWPVAIILPGLDACKEELHTWSNSFLDRGIATITLDGPGQGESAAHFPISLDWGNVMAAVITFLETHHPEVDMSRVGVVGQSLGAFYSPLSAALEPRLKACISNCGPFNFGPVLPQMPKVSQDLFRIRAHLSSLDQALEFAHELTLQSKAKLISCPTLIVFGAGDKIIPASEGELLKQAIQAKAELVVYEEGNHVCFNIPYKFRPLTADWFVEQMTR